jgi:hypothetical protein
MGRIDKGSSGYGMVVTHSHIKGKTARLPWLTVGPNPKAEAKRKHCGHRTTKCTTIIDEIQVREVEFICDFIKTRSVVARDSNSHSILDYFVDA